MEGNLSYMRVSLADRILYIVKKGYEKGEICL